LVIFGRLEIMAGAADGAEATFLKSKNLCDVKYPDDVSFVRKQSHSFALSFCAIARLGRSRKRAANTDGGRAIKDAMHAMKKMQINRDSRDEGNGV
jgi:hypothetical protein